MSAAGVSLQVHESEASFASALPAAVRLDDYPALKQLAWQLPGVTEPSPA